MIYTVIAKPTKQCNADCSYCSAPPDDANAWTTQDFQTIFTRLTPSLADGAYFIWHGGEPMLMGPDFYRNCFEFARSHKPNIRFSMQTNLLLYKSKQWREVFGHIMNGRISTSFDPDEKNRTIKGNTQKYTAVFKDKLESVLQDGFHPLVIGTYSEDTIDYAWKMYEWASQYGDQTFDIRYNYRFPAGRDAGHGVAISPESYGKMLLSLYNQWIQDAPAFSITPLDQMFKKCIGINMGQCPWTRACGGKFISIEPNGDVYNCGEFADLQNPTYRFGNIKQGVLPLSGKSGQSVINIVKKPKAADRFSTEMMNSHAARLMKRRVVNLPMSCSECRHFAECEGGCMRDAELYGRGLGGKFYYCSSWMMVFDRIKQSIINNEADAIIARYTDDVEAAKNYARHQANLHPELQKIIEDCQIC